MCASQLNALFYGQPPDEGPTVLKYIELKTGHSDNGPAWVAHVSVSKSGRTVYFNGKALKRAGGSFVLGNHYDLETGEEYWVSGVKKDGSDRHSAGSGVVQIEASAVAEYLRVVGATELDASRFRVVPDCQKTDPAKFADLENRPLRG